MQQKLTRAAVIWRKLGHTEVVDFEKAWRVIFAPIFAERPRHRHGVKAELEYATLNSGKYLIVPFSSEVAGLPLDSGLPQRIAGYMCSGPQIPLGDFCAAEFFISPPAFEWTMIHTHEDHAYGGPYFVRAEWN